MSVGTQKHFFVSYARSDANVVRQFVDVLHSAFREQGESIDIWLDSKSLRPGQQWANEIERAIRDAEGILVFVSSASMKSEFVRHEMRSTLFDGLRRLIVPIFLERDIPPPLEFGVEWRQLGAISADATDPKAWGRAASVLARQLAEWLSTNRNLAPIPESAAKEIAAVAASRARDAVTSQKKGVSKVPPDSVFVVHGHDHAALEQVTAALGEIGVRSIVLSRIEGPAQSLLEKFFRFSAQARFAVVILSSDDYGASRLQYESEGVGDRALQFRARQNVMLELGFFYGQLGWENVLVLLKAPPRVFPNFERPSDLDGAVFDPIDDAGAWKVTLAKKLSDSGFVLPRMPSNRLLRSAKTRR